MENFLKSNPDPLRFYMYLFKTSFLIDLIEDVEFYEIIIFNIAENMPHFIHLRLRSDYKKTILSMFGKLKIKFNKKNIIQGPSTIERRPR